jgi:hypothetical protein
MTTETDQSIELKPIMGMSIKTRENSYVGRVYSSHSPTRLVFTLDFEKTDPADRWPTEFFCSDYELDPAAELYDVIVGKLCGGFMCKTEKEEQAIRDEAEELATKIVEELSSLAGAYQKVKWR